MTAGYSGTPLARKLGIKPATTVALLDEPDGFRRLLDPVPDGVAFRTSLRGRVDLVVAFFLARSRLRVRLPALVRATHPDAGLWLAWPKRASGVETDLTEDVLREVVLPTGMVDIKVCAIDETWSGLRFAHRRANR